MPRPDTITTALQRLAARGSNVLNAHAWAARPVAAAYLRQDQRDADLMLRRASLAVACAAGGVSYATRRNWMVQAEAHMTETSRHA